MAIIGGAIAAAGALGGSMIASKGAKDAQNAANNANLQAARETNELNKQMFDESRGSTGHTFLPTYTGDAEKDIWNTLYGTYSSGKTADQLRTEAANLQASLRPAVTGTQNYLNDLYSGKNLETSRGYYQPLWNERIAAAQAQASAIRQAYAKAQQQNMANAMRQGFYGGSSTLTRENQRNTLDAIQQAALVRSNALTQNAQEGAQLGLADLASRQSNLSNVYSLANNLNSFNNLDDAAAYTNYDNLASRLGMFNIGKGQFTYQNMPTVQPSISNGQIYGSALSNLGQVGLQYAMNKWQSNQTPTYASDGFGTAGYVPAGGFSSGDYATPADYSR